MPPIQSEVAVRSGTTAEWADTPNAPVLDVGELGVDLTTGDVRVGDGTTAFASLRRVGGIRTGRSTLVAGTVTVANTTVTANTIILAQHQTLGTVTAAKLLTFTRSAGVSFTITSTDNTDTSVIGWLLIEP